MRMFVSTRAEGRAPIIQLVASPAAVRRGEWVDARSAAQPLGSVARESQEVAERPLVDRCPADLLDASTNQFRFRQTQLSRLAFERRLMLYPDIDLLADHTSQVNQPRAHILCGIVHARQQRWAWPGRALTVPLPEALRFENTQRQEGADHPVRGVDDLADLQVDCHAGQSVGLLAAEATRADEVADHRPHGLFGGFHQVGGDAGGGVVRADVRPRGDGPARLELWLLQPKVAADREAQRGGHLCLDRRDADLAVALGGVAIARREERPVHADWQEERAAGSELLDVHVAAASARRGGWVLARLV